MRKQVVGWLLTCWLSGVLGGCGNSSENPQPSPPTVPLVTGSIIGTVNLLDEQGADLAKNGVTVALARTSPALTATSDANGRFELPNVPSGTYDVAFTYPNLPMMRRFQVAHAGGSQPTNLGPTTLALASGTVVAGLTFGTPQPGTAVPFTVTVANANAVTTYYVALFANTTAGVTAATGKLVAAYSFTGGVSSNTRLTKASLEGAGFPSGSQVYVAVYGSPAASPAYFDPSTNRNVYPSLNPTASPESSLVVP